MTPTYNSLNVDIFINLERTLAEVLWEDPFSSGLQKYYDKLGAHRCGVISSERGTSKIDVQTKKPNALPVAVFCCRQGQCHFTTQGGASHYLV